MKPHWINLTEKNELLEKYLVPKISRQAAELGWERRSGCKGDQATKDAAITDHLSLVRKVPLVPEPLDMPCFYVGIQCSCLCGHWTLAIFTSTTMFQRICKLSGQTNLVGQRSQAQAESTCLCLSCQELMKTGIWPFSVSEERLHQASQSVRLPNHRKTISMLREAKKEAIPISLSVSCWFWFLPLNFGHIEASRNYIFPKLKWSNLSEMLSIPPL